MVPHTHPAALLLPRVSSQVILRAKLYRRMAGVQACGVEALSLENLFTVRRASGVRRARSNLPACQGTVWATESML